jgi:hypothetical protein
MKKTLEDKNIAKEKKPINNKTREVNKEFGRNLKK